jgi:hypothetical protein
MMTDYWLTPPELMRDLEERYHFTFDPCPFPRTDHDGLKIEWGERNYVNPPFTKKDGGITAWYRKAIAEADKGKMVYILMPVNPLERQILVRARHIDDLGCIPWVATDGSGKRKAMRPIMGVLL